jgi:membrane protein DedA with SNARE-associated domain
LGYLLVMLGALVEGELSMLAVWMLCEEGSLHRGLLALVAASGAYLGDGLCYGLGRARWQRTVAVLPHGEAALGTFGRKLGHFAAKHPFLSLFLLRFQMFLRAVGCYSLGRMGLPARHFWRDNAPCCLIWAGFYAAIIPQLARLLQWVFSVYSALLGGDS